MARDEALQVVVATFPYPDGANFALDRVRIGQVRLHNQAILVRNEGGGLRVRDGADLGAGKGAVVGAIASLLLPGVGLIGGVVVGGLIAKFRDTAFADQQLRQMGAALTPSSSALVLVVDPAAVAIVLPIIEQARGTAAVSQIDDDLSLPEAPE